MTTSYCFSLCYKKKKTSFRVSQERNSQFFDKSFGVFFVVAAAVFFLVLDACDFQLKRNSKIDYLLFHSRCGAHTHFNFSSIFYSRFFFCLLVFDKEEIYFFSSRRRLFS